MLQRYIGSQFWPIASSVAHKHLLTCFDRNLSKCCHSIHRASFPVLGLTHSDGFPQPHRTHFPAFSWPHLMRSLSQPAQDWIAENPPHRWHQSTDQHNVHEIHGAPFCRLLEMAQTVDNAFHACLIVQRLTTLHNAGDTEVANIDVILQDDRLKNVERVLNNSAKYRGSSTYLRTLEELYPITSLDCTIIQSIVNWLLWMMRRMPVSEVLKVAEVHARHSETEFRRRALAVSLDTLERRWLELKKPATIVTLMYMMLDERLRRQTLLERLDDIVLDTAKHMHVKDLCRTLYILSCRRWRNMPVIRAVLHYLQPADLSRLTAVQLVNLTYACSTLSIHDAGLVKRIGSEAVLKEANLTPKLTCNLLTSFSRLRWDEPSVLSFILDLIEGRAGPVWSGDILASAPTFLDCVEAGDKSGILRSLAHLNVCTGQSVRVARMVAESEDVLGLREASPLLWLDVVWSLAVLRLLDDRSASSVLGDDFLKRLPVGDIFQSTKYQTKLKNIDCAAKFEVSQYTGPSVSATSASSDTKGTARKTAAILLDAVHEIAPADTYTLMDVTSSEGSYLIDAEFHVDDRGNPVPISMTMSDTNKHHRIALRVLDFDSLTMFSHTATGLNAMASRHLGLQGYTVVEVGYGEVAQCDKLMKLVQLITQKIKEALNVQTMSHDTPHQTME